jgi:hypothetical protein
VLLSAFFCSSPLHLRLHFLNTLQLPSSLISHHSIVAMLVDLGDYNVFSEKQLSALTHERGVWNEGLFSKAQLVVALEKHDHAQLALQQESHPKPAAAPPTKAVHTCTAQAYDKMAYRALQALIKDRRLITASKTREDLIDALKAADIRSCQACSPPAVPEIEVEDETDKFPVEQRLLRLLAITRQKNERWPDVFQRSFQADPLQRSFMCLPRELRDMVYAFTFDEWSETWHLRYSPDWDGLYTVCRTDSSEKTLLRALLVLSTLSREIRSEARETFWSMAVFKVVPIVPSNPRWMYTTCDPDYYSVCEWFTRRLGEDGRRGVKMLEFHGNYRYCEEFSTERPETLTKLMEYVADCTHLTTLRIPLDIGLLCQGDQASLETFILQNGNLDNEGVASFQKVISSLPYLVDLHLDLSPGHEARHEIRPIFSTDFLDFAFSGLRNSKLHIAVMRILSNTVLRHVHGSVFIDRPCLYPYISWAADDHDVGWEESIWAHCQFAPNAFEEWIQSRSPIAGVGEEWDRVVAERILDGTM